MKKYLQYLLGIACMCALLSCSVQSKNTNSNVDSTTTEGPAPLNKQTIDINSIIAEGLIRSEDNKTVFIVSKVLKRGRQAPTVLTNQKLLLEANKWTESHRDKNIKAIVKCNQPNVSNTKWIIVEVI